VTCDAAPEIKKLLARFGRHIKCGHSRFGLACGISNLQFRLYMVASSTTAPVVPGIPPGSTLITAWMGPPSGSNQVSASFTDVQAGTYILDIAGIASGNSGGTYVGQLNLNAAVPLPAALPLMLCGLALMMLLLGRRALAPAPVG
jgi:hypothetical protein